nr:hypothetical protein CFP56_63560 [Quercus suber]
MQLPGTQRYVLPQAFPQRELDPFRHRTSGTWGDDCIAGVLRIVVLAVTSFTLAATELGDCCLDSLA